MTSFLHLVFSAFFDSCLARRGGVRERATRKKGVAEGRGEKQTHLSTSMVNFLGSVAAMVGDKVPNSV